jgi:branched-chain amino acid transport system substrate-binding protein
MKHAPNLTGDAIRAELTKVKDFDGVSGKITIDGQRNAQKSAVVLKIVGGKFKYETTVAP